MAFSCTAHSIVRIVLDKKRPNIIINNQKSVDITKRSAAVLGAGKGVRQKMIENHSLGLPAP